MRSTRVARNAGRSIAAKEATATETTDRMRAAIAATRAIDTGPAVTGSPAAAWKAANADGLRRSGGRDWLRMETEFT